MRAEFRNKNVLVLFCLLIYSFATLPAQVVPTSEWISLYSTSSTLDGAPVAVGSVIRVFDPDGNLCGESAIAETGKFGFLQVYRDDETSPGLDEGALPGDTLSFTINNRRTVSRESVIWSQNGQVAEVFLEARTNWPPEIINIPGQTVNEGSQFTPVSLDQYVLDPDHDPSSMTWIVTGNIQLYPAIANRVLSVTMPNQDWYGSETLRLIVSDPGGLRDTIFVTYTVNPVNDPPQISAIPGQTINEGSTFAPINLASYASDVDNPVTSLVWSVSGYSQLTAVLNGSILNVAVPNADWYGNEMLRLIVSDPGGLRDTTFVPYTVNPVNDPPLISAIPGQTINEGGSFAQLNLSSYVSDVDNSVSSLVWSVSGNLALGTGLNGSVLTVSVPDVNWYGSESLRLIVTDPGGLRDTVFVTFTVNPVNDRPQIFEIPNQVIGEGEIFATLNLASYVSDIDDPVTSLTWSFSGFTELEAELNGAILSVSTPAENWNGSEIIRLIVSDPGGLRDTAWVNYRVTADNDPPLLSEFPNQMIAEGGSFPVLDLSGYVTDIDDPVSSLVWSVSGNLALGISLNGLVLTVSVPDVNWYGSETLRLIVSDPGGLRDTAFVVYTVSPVNDAPQIRLIPNQNTFEGGTFPDLNLSSYVSDVDDTPASLIWTVSGYSQLSAGLSGSNLSVSIPDVNWYGSETLRLIVSDPGGLRDTAFVMYTVNPVNDPPQILVIPDQVISEGQTFPLLNLSAYVSDIDNSITSLVWTVSGATELGVNLNGTQLSVIVPGEEWNGQESLRLIVRDPGGLRDTAFVTFTVIPVNDPPVIAFIPDQIISEGQTFPPLDLSARVSDPDNDAESITWSVSGQKDLLVSLSGDVLTVTPPGPSWFGSEILRLIATDPGGQSDTCSVLFGVGEINHAPQISAIPEQTTPEGGSFAQIDLRAYTIDTDDPFSSLIWSVINDGVFTASIQNGILQVSLPGADWSGSQMVIFRVTDPHGLSAEGQVNYVVIPVNDAPGISDIPGQTIDEGGEFQPLELDLYVVDVDNADSTLTWTCSGMTDLEVTIENRIADIRAPDLNWAGSELLTFRVMDPAGLVSNDTARFTVDAINDPPRITSLPVTGATQDSLYQYQVRAEDPDTDDRLIFQLAADAGFLNIDSESGLVSGYPRQQDVGPHTVTILVTDLAGAEDDQTYTLRVFEVNDAPVLNPLPAFTINEGSTFLPIDLGPYVSDPDHPDDSLAWEISGQKSLGVILDGCRLTVTIPDTNWFGSELLTFRVTDPGGLQATGDSRFTVLPINDPPMISAIPDRCIDMGETFDPIDLNDHVQDIDDSDSVLVWQCLRAGAFHVEIDQGILRIFLPDVNWTGTDYIILRVADPAGLADRDTIYFTVKNGNVAPRFSDLPGIIMNEDDSLTVRYEVLREYVIDPDNCLEDLVFSFVSGIDLNCTPVNDGFSICAPLNWFGCDSLTLFVSDGAATDTAILNVTVLPVNDAPWINLPDSLGFGSDTSLTIDMSGYCGDIETADSLLQYTFTLPDSQISYCFNRGKCNLMLYCKTSFEQPVKLIVTVTDDSLSSQSDSTWITGNQIVDHLPDDAGKNSGIFQFTLEQNYPNPFNSRTHIVFTLPGYEYVTLEIFNPRGQKICTLVDGNLTPGNHSVSWQANAVAAGIYFYRIHAGQNISTRKLILLK